MVHWHLNGFLSHEMFSSLFCKRKRISRRLILIAIWNNKISTLLLGEIMFPPCFALWSRVFQWDPVFSTPRVFHQTPCFPLTTGPRNPAPRTPYPGTPAPPFPPSLLTMCVQPEDSRVKSVEPFFAESATHIQLGIYLGEWSKVCWKYII